jgi:hypothetical protein
MNRDTQLQSIRPQINVEDLTNEPMEHFQNHTLRQILKFQNDALLAICKDFLQNKYKNFEGRDQTIKHSLLHEALKTDQALKKLLYGMVIGHFTSNELNFYILHKSEINKRLVEFIFKRLSTQLVF